MDIKEIVNARQADNKKILSVLAEYIESHPVIRFEQMLYILRLECSNNDYFYEEPSETYKRIEKILKQEEMKYEASRIYP